MCESEMMGRATPARVTPSQRLPRTDGGRRCSLYHQRHRKVTVIRTPSPIERKQHGEFAKARGARNCVARVNMRRSRPMLLARESDREGMGTMGGRSKAVRGKDLGLLFLGQARAQHVKFLSRAEHCEPEPR